VAALNLRLHVFFWLGLFAVVIVAMWLLGAVLLPFVAGMAMAYVLNPPTNRLQNLGLPRWAASLMTLSLMVLGFVLLILLIAPVIGAQLAAFIDDLPGYVRRLQALVTDPSRPWLNRLVGDRFVDADKSVGGLVTQGAGIATALLGTVWSGGQAVFSVISLLVITPVVAYYFLVDWPRIIAQIDQLIPRAEHATVVALAGEADTAIAGFVRGQTFVCLLLGLFYALALSLLGLNFGLLIGLISGLISFIPYVGTITGLVLSVGVALPQFWPEWMWIAAVVAVFLVGQFIEGNILVPKLVGDRVGLHPLVLMFALLAFGYLFGFVGLLLAVPLAAAIGVLTRFAVRRYLESPLYARDRR
jgi:predicted PurR-regulated permease PerM